MRLFIRENVEQSFSFLEVCQISIFLLKKKVFNKTTNQLSAIKLETINFNIFPHKFLCFDLCTHRKRKKISKEPQNFVYHEWRERIFVEGIKECTAQHSTLQVVLNCPNSHKQKVLNYLLDLVESIRVFMFKLSNDVFVLTTQRISTIFNFTSFSHFLLSLRSPFVFSLSSRISGFFT